MPRRTSKQASISSDRPVRAVSTALGAVQEVRIAPGDVLAGTRVWVGTVPAEPGAPELLDDREQARGSRYTGKKRASYVQAHGLRRLLLADCSGMDPARLEFTADRTGYPDPVERDGVRWFHSVSHSGSFVAVAVAENRRLGVDIERLRTIRHPDELAGMLGADGTGDADVLAAWVRWEALAKATGQGLARRLHPVPDRLPAAGKSWHVSSLRHQQAHLAVAVSLCAD